MRATPRSAAGVLVAVLMPVLALGVLAGTATPAAADTTARLSDGFSRTVASGWGSATSGGAWTVSTPSRFAVTGGAGTISLTSDGVTQRASLSPSGTTNDIAVTFAPSRLPTGGGVYVAVVGRRVPGAGQYEAKVHVLSTGVVALSLVRVDPLAVETVLTRETAVPGLRAAAGRTLRVHLRAVGASPTTLRARVWAAAATEPTAWTASATDGTAQWQASGGTGIEALSSKDSVALGLRVDNLAATLTTPSPAPPPPPPPSPPPPRPAPVPGSGRPATATAGALPVGTAQYPAPPDADYVSPTGDDTATGTVDAPWQTLAHAVAAAPTGATIVLRGGTYTESVTIPAGQQVTVQNAPGEAAWLDGSRIVDGWVTDGSAWRVDGWTAQFDSSPTYTSGAPDGTAPNWQWVNPAYPMAAHPDQVFIDDVPLQQVAGRTAVGPGTFAVDYGAHRLFIGSDPTGHTVRASVLGTALTINGAGSVVRGLGIERYATSVPQMGTLRVLGPDVTVENVVVSDNATEGVFVGGNGITNGVRATLRNVTAVHNGLMGIAGSFADGLLLDGVVATANNTERFNVAPVAGGVKICSSRDITVRNGIFSGNIGDGLWFDSSVYDATVVGDDVVGNTADGIAFEISATAVIAGNLVTCNGTGNAFSGLKLNDASALQVWNNTVVDNAGRPVWLVQDSRQASNVSTPGHDPRQPLPDPTVTWLLGPVTFMNNVLGGQTAASCLLCAQDSALYRSPSDIAITADGNVYGRASATVPASTATWPAGTAATQLFSSLPDFLAATGQEAHGAEFTGVPLTDSTDQTAAPVVAVEPTTAQPLPDVVAGVTGRTSGELHLGAWF